MQNGLYNSYNLEFSRQSYPNNVVCQAATFSFWSDTPVPKYKVGDAISYDKLLSPEVLSNYSGSKDTASELGTYFEITKIRITDEVIGERNGSPFRQWQFTLDGFIRNVEILNDNPIISKYSTTAEKSENGDTLFKATLETICFGSEPRFLYEIGNTFSIPGIPVSLTCTNYSFSDAFNDINKHVWTITYEGSATLENQSDSEEILPQPKYNIAIEKDSDGLLQKSGSKIIVVSGDTPTLDISVGSTFNIPGIGNVTCSKVSGNDDYSDSGAHRWTMTYEGYINDGNNDDDTQSSDNADTKYNFSIEKNSNGNLAHSGSVEITTISNEPPSTYQVGSSISIPGIGEVTCVKVSGSDAYTENGRRKWVIVYEGSDNNEDSQGDEQQSFVKYSFSIENNSDGVPVYSWTKEVSYKGDTPDPDVQLGDTFTLPVVGVLTCTNIKGSNDGADNWTFSIEGSRTGGSSSGEGQQDDSSLPDNEEAIAYEINGITVRTVDGEIIALRRSETPICKKTITVYSTSDELISTLGSIYQGGIALSENVIKETTKVNGVVTGSYYKHTIEVEA